MSVGVLGQADTPTFSVGAGVPIDPPAPGDPTLYLDTTTPALHAWDDDALAWLDVTGAGGGVAPLNVVVEGSDAARAAGPAALPIAFNGPDNGWIIEVDNTVSPPVAGTYAVIANFEAVGVSAGYMYVRLFSTTGAAANMSIFDLIGRTALAWVGVLDPANGVGLYLDQVDGPGTLDALWSMQALRVG